VAAVGAAHAGLPANLHQGTSNRGLLENPYGARQNRRIYPNGQVWFFGVKTPFYTKG
jgi:hypothetical protein